MDTNAVVEGHIDEGQRLIAQLVRDGIDVAAAFWGVTSDEGFIYLYIILKGAEENGPAESYHKVYDALQGIHARWVDVTRVKLITAATPLAKEVLSIRRRSPTKTGVWLYGDFANFGIAQAYIYPPFVSVPRKVLTGERMRLKTAVEQTTRLDEVLAPLSASESRALEQIVASGASRTQAEYWVRKKREQGRPPIPAGTIVNAQVVAWWGDKPEDDPNPLFRVEAPDGSQGFAFKNDLEPV